MPREWYFSFSSFTGDIVAEKQVTAYDYSNDRLIDAFTDACVRAGISNSGRFIDFMAGPNLREAHYLRGVTLSRLDGKTPFFKHGDVVVVKANIQTVRPRQYWGPEIGHNANFSIWRVHYDNGRWFLEFKEIRSDLGVLYFDAEKFELDKFAAPTV